MKKLTILLATAMVMSAGPAWAGTVVKGYGGSRSAAVEDAERKARQLAKQKGTCYEYVDASACSQDSGGWVCSADVANHQGSCGGTDKVKP